MANKNEDINKQKAKNKEPKKKQSWVGHIVEEIQEEEEKSLDTDFPLSGGDEPLLHPSKKSKKGKQAKKSSFSHDLDTEFPLSGGEVDE